MKTRIILSESWDEMKQAVSDAKAFLGIFNVSIDTVNLPVDISDKGVYDTNISNNKKGDQMTTSLSPSFIYGLHNGHYSYDCYGVMVDRSKAKDVEMGLYGQQSTLGNGRQTVEAYVVRKKKGEHGFPFASYTLIHELIHALADHHGVEDTLHGDLKAGKTLEQCREILIDRVLEIQSDEGLLPVVGTKMMDVWTYAQFTLKTPIKILEGYRSPERQSELYNQKPKVTNAKAWESMHQYRIAFDYCFEGKVPFPPSGDPKWNAVNVYARSIGLYSYGIEESFDDGHLQLLFGKSEKSVRNGDVDWSKYWNNTPVEAPQTPPQRLKFDRDLMKGSKGEDVVRLQKFLNQEGFLVAVSGPGSKGNETDYFGELTRKALASWQRAHGIAPSEGYFGPITRARIND